MKQFLSRVIRYSQMKYLKMLSFFRKFRFLSVGNRTLICDDIELEGGGQNYYWKQVRLE